MKLFAIGAVGIGVLGAATLAFGERPELPTCGADIVKEIITTNISESAPTLIVRELRDGGGDMRDGRWHCTATLSTDRGPVPVKYSVGLFGPGRLNVSMAASLPR